MKDVYLLALLTVAVLGLVGSIAAESYYRIRLYRADLRAREERRQAQREDGLL